MVVGDCPVLGGACYCTDRACDLFRYPTTKREVMKYNNTVPARTRRRGVISRLEAQLKSGKKNSKEGVVPLTEKDIARINKELETLNKRI